MNQNASLFNTLLDQAEVTAQTSKQGRSRLHKQALEHYLTRCNDEEVTDNLNKVYASRPSKLHSAWRCLQTHLLRRNKW